MFPNRLKGLAAGLTATLIWGGFYAVGRWLNSGAGNRPDELAASLARFFIAALALLPALIDRKALAELRLNWRRADDGTARRRPAQKWVSAGRPSG